MFTIKVRNFEYRLFGIRFYLKKPVWMYVSVFELVETILESCSNL